MLNPFAFIIFEKLQLLSIKANEFNHHKKLPMKMPSSMEAVEKPFEDVSYDSENPLYMFGHRLSY